ncbi:SGNH/GDSL hydrolase family protein [Rhodococcus fascians]|nr:SGNH/GDSL hydrolase family protein [Rhodococcus fascians]MBY3824004.1 SGNH/GDSL hydrolase family protein [Rhodococcus fascians]MBY3834526.1 SGNH/GDSL hydrolase family protein [Rhodococcus fascians]MBY3863738.1 SGNH/GDSL hydrolase family protein [Rhodococcus fascians]MBY3883209.1 SGNH/GDSL hydrolase family protein [Rhodococcus fascians]
MTARRTVLISIAVSVLVVAFSGIVGWQIGSRSEAPQAATPPPVSIPDSVPVVAFLGDSYSKGIGASSNGQRWTTLVSAEMGWSELNLAEGGSGYTTSYLGQKTDYGIKLDVVAAAQPDVVVVSGGRNDYEAGTASVTGAVASSLFAAIKAAAPNTEVIVTSPIWDSTEPPAEFATLIDGVKAATASAEARYVDIGEPLADHPDMIDPDGLHPNNGGHQIIASAVVSALL